MVQNNALLSKSADIAASEPYHRQAFFYCRDDLAAPDLHASYGRHRDAFRSAIALMDGEARAVAIPYEATTLNGYLFRPAGDDVARPTVLLPAGYDSTAESGWVDGASMVLERGMNALTFDWYLSVSSTPIVCSSVSSRRLSGMGFFLDTFSSSAVTS